MRYITYIGKMFNNMHIICELCSALHGATPHDKQYPVDVHLHSITLPTDADPFSVAEKISRHSRCTLIELEFTRCES